MTTSTNNDGCLGGLMKDLICLIVLISLLAIGSWLEYLDRTDSNVCLICNMSAQNEAGFKRK